MSSLETISNTSNTYAGYKYLGAGQIVPLGRRAGSDRQPL